MEISHSVNTQRNLFQVNSNQENSSRLSDKINNKNIINATANNLPNTQIESVDLQNNCCVEVDFSDKFNVLAQIDLLGKSDIFGKSHSNVSPRHTLNILAA